MKHAAIATLVWLGSGVLAVPARRGSIPIYNEPHIEHRDLDFADIDAHLRSIARDQTRYARRAEEKASRHNSTTWDRRDSAPKPKQRSTKEPRAGYDPPIHVPLSWTGTSGESGQQYLAESSIGTGNTQQTFNTRFDTIGRAYAVPSQFCDPGNGCQGLPKDLYQEVNGVVEGLFTFPPKFGGGIEADIAVSCYDDVTVAGITAPRLRSMSMRKVSKLPVWNGVSEAIMGLSPLSLDTSPLINYFSWIVKKGTIGNRPPEISFFFGRPKAGSTAQSQLSIGGRDPDLFNLDPTPILLDIDQFGPAYWEVPLIGFKKNTIEFYDDRPRIATFDTVSTTITMDYDGAKILFDHVKGAFPVLHTDQKGADGQPTPNAVISWAYPCYPPPLFWFKLGKAPGTLFYLNVMDLNLGKLNAQGSGFVDMPGSTNLATSQAGDTAYCLSSILSNSRPLPPGDEGFIYLGIPFLRSWYSIYSLVDPPTVSLAEARWGRLTPSSDGSSAAELPQPPPSYDPIPDLDVSQAVADWTGAGFGEGAERDKPMDDDAVSETSARTGPSTAGTEEGTVGMAA